VPPLDDAAKRMVAADDAIKQTTQLIGDQTNTKQTSNKVARAVLI
jgi:hypothetical protein